MKIRAGYEISYDCPQPTPMILALSVHPSRLADLMTEDRLRLDPQLPANTYNDSFGNFCHVISAPAGRLTLSTDFLVHDNGEPDAAARQAEQYALEDLPVEALIYLLGSRYCETDRLSSVAWSLFGQVRKGWPLVQAICDRLVVLDHGAILAEGPTVDVTKREDVVAAFIGPTHKPAVTPAITAEVQSLP